MKKYLYLFSIALLLSFVSCTESFLYEEPEEEPEEEILPTITDWDTISVDIDMYPD